MIRLKALEMARDGCHVGMRMKLCFDDCIAMVYLVVASGRVDHTVLPWRHSCRHRVYIATDSREISMLTQNHSSMLLLLR